MSEERLRLLLVDDEASLRIPLKRLLESRFGYLVDAAADSREALALVEQNSGRYDVALLDEVLHVEELPSVEEADGIELMQRIKAHYPEMEAIIFTGWGRGSRQRAIRAGAFRYLEKPLDYDELGMVLRTAAQQVRLRAISRQILLEKDPDRVLEGIMAAACALALADEAAIVLLDEATGQLKIHTQTRPMGPQWGSHFRQPGLSRQILSSGRAVRISDTSLDERVNPELPAAGIHAFLGLPIPGEGGNLGALYVYSRRPGWFEEWATVAVLQMLAGQASLALANARAFEQVQAHGRYMEALVRAGQGLTQATRLEDQLSLAWDFVREQLQTSTFFVALWDRPGRALRFPLAYDEGTRLHLPDIPEGQPWGITGYVIRSGQELVWPTAEASGQICRTLGIEPIRIGKPCQSCIYLPLLVGAPPRGCPPPCGCPPPRGVPLRGQAGAGEVAGAISIQSYSPHAFPPALLAAFRALGSQLAVALKNTRLLAELTEAKEWREALIENAFDAVVAIDPDKRVTVFNKRAEEMFGWTEEEMLRQTVIPLHTDLKKAQEIFDWIEREGSLSGWEVELKHRNGEPIPALLSARQICDSRGQAIGQAGFIRDLRAARRLEDRLRGLIQVNRAITGTFALDDVLQTVIEAAVGAFPAADGGSIHLYDEATGDLHIRATTFGCGDDLLEASRFRPGEGIAGWVYQHGQAAVVDDVGLDPRYKPIGHPQAPAHRSLICMPLRVRERVIGTLSLDSLKATAAFRDEDLGLLSSFVDQAAIAIHNARLVARMQSTREAAGAIAGITVQEDLNRTLLTIAQQAQHVLGSDAVTLYAYDEATRRVTGWAGEIRQPRDPDSVRPPERLAQDSVVWNILRLTEPPFVCMAEEKAARHDILAGYFIRAEGVEAAIGLQLRVGERKVGVMFVNYRSAHHFTPDETATIRLFAHQAAVAIRNAQLYAETVHLYQQAKLVADISRETAQHLELGAFLRSLFSRLTQVFAERGIPVYLTLATYDEATRCLAFHQTDFYPEKLPTEPVPLDAPGIIPWVARTRQPHCAADVRSDPHYVGLRANTLSEVAVPILFGGQLLGVLDLESPKPAAFAGEELQLLQVLAHQIATTMRNVQQYEDLRRARGVIGARTALAWMGMASNAWRHAIEKVALTIREQAQLLRQDWGRVASHPPEARVPDRIAAIERLASMILDRPITPPLSAEEGVESVSLNALVGERARQLWQNDPYRQATLRLDLTLPEAATVRLSPEWLRRAFDIVVDNAVDAVANRPLRDITIATRQLGRQAEIRISDTGPGIAEEIRARIGLEMIEKPEDARGLGMGLLMAQTIVQTYGGEIAVGDSGPDGTTMVIRLPLEATTP